MGIYKKNKKILQELLFNCSLLCSLCLMSLTLMPDAFAEDSQARWSEERKAINEGNQEEIKMSDKDKLTREEGEYLLSLARKTIEEKLFNKDTAQNKADLPDKFIKKGAAFVTLNSHGNLRGCIGHIIPQIPLIDCVKANALSAAFKDPRFPPLSKEEWKDIEVEISILTEPEQLEYTDADDLLEKLRPGTDGVILRKNNYQSTFLPQVWDQLPDKKEFLSHLCSKAGMDANEWRKGDLTVYTYQVQAFEEH